MKWLSFLVVAILLADCGGNHPTLSLEQVVARGIPRNAQQFQVLATGVAPDGSVAVVYSYRVRFPIEYDVYQDGYTAVYGPLQSARIEAVEAHFSNGEAVRQEFQGSGFLIFLDERADVCELRFFDVEGQLLEGKVLSNRSERIAECPRP